MGKFVQAPGVKRIDAAKPPAAPNFVRTRRVRGVPIHDVTKDSARDWVLLQILHRNAPASAAAFFVNAHTLNLAAADAEYRELLTRGDAVFGDGTGVRWAGKLQGVRVRDNLVGTDFVPHLFTTSPPDHDTTRQAPCAGEGHHRPRSEVCTRHGPWHGCQRRAVAGRRVLRMPVVHRRARQRARGASECGARDLSGAGLSAVGAGTAPVRRTGTCPGRIALTRITGSRHLPPPPCTRFSRVPMSPSHPRSATPKTPSLRPCAWPRNWPSWKPDAGRAVKSKTRWRIWTACPTKA